MSLVNLRVLNMPTVFQSAELGNTAVVVIAEAKDGRTLIANTAVGIYKAGLHTQLHPDWTCGVGEAAGAIYEALVHECVNDETVSCGFYTRTSFAGVNQLANYAIKALADQARGIAA